jgi:hypothetical protein
MCVLIPTNGFTFYFTAQSATLRAMQQHFVPGYEDFTSSDALTVVTNTNNQRATFDNCQTLYSFFGVGRLDKTRDEHVADINRLVTLVSAVALSKVKDRCNLTLFEWCAQMH